MCIKDVVKCSVIPFHNLTRFVICFYGKKTVRLLVLIRLKGKQIVNYMEFCYIFQVVSESLFSGLF